MAIILSLTSYFQPVATHSRCAYRLLEIRLLADRLIACNLQKRREGAQGRSYPLWCILRQNISWNSRTRPATCAHPRSFSELLFASHVCQASARPYVPPVNLFISCRSRTEFSLTRMLISSNVCFALFIILKMFSSCTSTNVPASGCIAPRKSWPTSTATCAS